MTFSLLLHCARQAAIALFLLLAAASVSRVLGQPLDLTIDVIPTTPGRLLIQASGSPSSSWSFRDSYAGILNLGNRVHGFQVLNAQGRQIAVRKTAPGQFASAEPATTCKYEIELAPAGRPADAALTSWLGAERGVLMFGDFLPTLDSQTPDGQSHITARIVLPSGWKSYSVEKQIGSGEFEINDPDRAVVIVGRKIRTSGSAILNKQFTLATDGEWAFADNEALDLAANVLKLHNEVGELPCDSSALILLQFPQTTSTNRWSALTRGCTVTLLMGRLPSKVSALAELGLALTHEMFHFWVPNGLSLTGDYDWFFEGFTMYEAARAAVRLDLLTFEQFLNANADAYNGSSSADTQTLSLIEASKQRWTGGGATVYSKAMVVAFLYDLNLRYQTKGKRSLDDVYRNVVRTYLRQSASSPNADGNAAAVSTLRAETSTQDLVDRLVITRVTIDLEKELALFGLHIEKLGLRNRIYANAQLTGRQRDLLKQLGYNEPRARRKVTRNRSEPLAVAGG